MVELQKKCPWCGYEKHKLMNRDVGKYSNKHTIFYGLCLRCKARSPFRKHSYEVLEDFKE